MEKAKASGTQPERCWCMDAVFTPEVMVQVLIAAKGKACICAKCAGVNFLSSGVQAQGRPQSLRF